MSGELQLVAAFVTFIVALLASRSLGMAIGAVVMQAGAWVRDPVLVALGAVIAAFFTPDRPTTGGSSGRPRHAG